MAQEERPIKLKVSDLDEEVNGLFVFREEEEIWVLVADLNATDEVDLLGEGYYTFANYSPGVFVEGRVLKDGKPVAYQPMQWDLGSLSNRICATEQGRWIAVLPEKEEVGINLLNPCSESLQSESLQINSTDITDETLIIEDNEHYQLMDLMVLDCEGNIISAPNLNIGNGESETQYAFSQGNPDLWIAVCDDFTIEAIDESTGESGPQINWSTSIMDNPDVIAACEDLKDGYSFIKIRTEKEIFKPFTIEVEDNRTIIASQDGSVKFLFRGTEEGFYQENEVNVAINDPDFGDKGYFIQCENSSLGCGIDSFNVTHYNQDEGTFRVAFSGSLWMQTISPSVAGEFKIEGIIVIKL